jgi:hypothetical protein
MDHTSISATKRRELKIFSFVSDVIHPSPAQFYNVSLQTISNKNVSLFQRLRAVEKYSTGLFSLDIVHRHGKKGCRGRWSKLIPIYFVKI